MQMEKNMNNQDSARVRAWLEQGVLLFDGATGTALRAQAEEGDRKSTRLNSSHGDESRMPSSA